MRDCRYRANEPPGRMSRYFNKPTVRAMKRHFIITTLICLMVASVTITVPSAGAKSPQIYVVGENGFLGVNANGEVHYVLTSDGFRLYDISSYGYCGRHHRCHSCRYVHPAEYKHHKKHYKKVKKERKKRYKKFKKEQKKYYKHHSRRHHHDHDDDDD